MSIVIAQARIRCTFAFGIALTSVAIAAAQESNPTSDPKNTPNTIQALDQLIEQNQRLEKQNQQIANQNEELKKQNQQLMEQIKVLRGAVIQRANVSEQAVEPASTQATAGVKVGQTGQSSSGDESNDDDKTQLPEGSEGNPAIFGEFNPGRGFTVAQGEYGKLNLSGYMAVRYLDQLPGEQSATDHLRRPINVTPRQDFQFHRVMLFSQGWLFSPKFQYSTFLWTVQDTNQVAVGGALYYNFGKYLMLGAGWNARELLPRRSEGNLQANGKKPGALQRLSSVP